MEPLSRDDERSYRFSFYKKRDSRLRRLMSKRASTITRSTRGRYISYTFPKSRPWDVAIGPTIRAAAPHQRIRGRYGPGLEVDIDDIRIKVRESQSPLSVVILLDLSESMVASLVNVRNAILSMRDVVFHRRDRLGLVVFKGLSATTLQQPTPNVSLLVDKLSELGASDFTPLASGMYEALRVLRNERNRNKDVVPILALITDGIANIALDTPLPQSSRGAYINTAQADVFDVAYLLRKEGVITVVINPNHIPSDKVAPKSFKDEIQAKSGKMWLDPTTLLLEIPRITGGYYYGIEQGGDLKEVMLTEAFSLLSRRSI
jgi:Mg-chelatase subunit ChlD